GDRGCHHQTSSAVVGRGDGVADPGEPKLDGAIQATSALKGVDRHEIQSDLSSASSQLQERMDANAQHFQRAMQHTLQSRINTLQNRNTTFRDLDIGGAQCPPDQLQELNAKIASHEASSKDCPGIQEQIQEYERNILQTKEAMKSGNPYGKEQLLLVRASSKTTKH
ncbi:MAG: hypothetical protein H7836_18215, partial [Magnetococcus sp. YQC-3]